MLFSSFAPFTQKSGVRLSSLTLKRGRRSAKSEEIRSQWQAAREFLQDQVSSESISKYLRSSSFHRMNKRLQKEFGDGLLRKRLALGSYPFCY